MEKNQSTVQSSISFKVTSTVVTSVHSEPITTLPFDALPSRINVIVGSVFGGVVIVSILPLAFIIRYVMVMRRKTRKQENDLALAETAAPGERHEQGQDNNQQANVGDGNETDPPDSSADDPEETAVPVQESGDNINDKTGIQETKLPGRHGDTGKSRLKRSFTA